MAIDIYATNSKTKNHKTNMLSTIIDYLQDIKEEYSPITSRAEDEDPTVCYFEWLRVIYHSELNY